jgi:hypothetical protein
MYPSLESVVAHHPRKFDNCTFYFAPEGNQLHTDPGLISEVA